jgi:hypothetical protein
MPMPSLLHCLSDYSLPRVYKFILKRTIGHYLQDDLLIQQLQVNSKDGELILRDLALSASLINEEIFSNSLLCLHSAKINVVRAYLSFSSLLTEGCRFEIDNIHIVLQPNPNMINKSKHGSTYKQSTSINPSLKCQTGEQAEESFASEEGREGLHLIANWIEVIIAKLQVLIKSVTIDVHTSLSLEDSPSLSLRFENLLFFNTDPQTPAGQSSSMDISSLLTTNSSKDDPVTLTLGNSKVLRIQKIEILLQHKDNFLRIMQVHGNIQCRLLLGMNAGDKGIEADINITNVELSLDSQKLLLLQQVMSSWTQLKSCNTDEQNTTATGRANEMASSVSELQRALQSQGLRRLLQLERDFVANGSEEYTAEADFNDHELALLLYYMKKVWL